MQPIVNVSFVNITQRIVFGFCDKEVYRDSIMNGDAGTKPECDEWNAVRGGEEFESAGSVKKAEESGGQGGEYHSSAVNADDDEYVPPNKKLKNTCYFSTPKKSPLERFARDDRYKKQNHDSPFTEERTPEEGAWKQTAELRNRKKRFPAVKNSLCDENEAEIVQRAVNVTTSHGKDA
ncbi:hypothetical protein PRIPAC_75253 [Pristionchus pacificus]|uniref:Uncharacterized protein n=1 Tax=Pristionchus pacificus TaxID=54126 RepID=A0A2A6C668_PRIPA|nr:hypothetical protein PRIPAC_75253 [Pristionchus pacificus]|eukprot:PDM73649.1 hypothetical protein PRIPAC_41005 [Pristionchus pacificus]